jgi:hypothetical protein
MPASGCYAAMLATEGHMIEKALGASDLEPGMQALLGGNQ